MKKYPKHVDSYGGLFTRIMRQNLLGINPKNDLPYNDTANFWSDVRKSVKNGLVDIQLVCSIANSDQIQKMFQHTLDYPNQENTLGGIISEKDYYTLSPNLISAIRSILQVNNSRDPKHIQEIKELENERKKLQKKYENLDITNKQKIEITKKINVIDSKILGNDPKQYLWQAEIAKRMICECLNFFISKHLISSPVHEAHLRQVNLILNSELSRYNQF